MFSNCNTAKDTSDKLIKLVGKTPLSDIQNEISKKFYNVESIVEFIYNTLLSRGNGILHGPGGFGKSQVIKAFFEYFNINPYVVIGHTGTDVESLLGIPNIKKLTEESKYEIAFENSIFNNAGVIIFEEFLDVKPMVAAALKDIITEGGYRRGDEFIHSKIGSMFICSNKSPEEVTIDFSTGAFYKERFPYSKYVIWNNFASIEYLNLFKLVFKDKYEQNTYPFKLISEICASSCNSDSVISPRVAISAMNLFLITNKIESLEMLAALNLSKIDEIINQIKTTQQYKHLNEKFKFIQEEIIGLKFKDVKYVVAFISIGNTLKDQFSNYNLVGDELLATVADVIKIIDIKLKEANDMLFAFGKSYNELSKITNINENIQEYLYS